MTSTVASTFMGWVGGGATKADRLRREGEGAPHGLEGLRSPAPEGFRGFEATIRCAASVYEATCWPEPGTGAERALLSRYLKDMRRDGNSVGFVASLPADLAARKVPEGTPFEVELRAIVVHGGGHEVVRMPVGVYGTVMGAEGRVRGFVCGWGDHLRLQAAMDALAPSAIPGLPRDIEVGGDGVPTNYAFAPLGGAEVVLLDSWPTNPRKQARLAARIVAGAGRGGVAFVGSPGGLGKAGPTLRVSMVGADGIPHHVLDAPGSVVVEGRLHAIVAAADAAAIAAKVEATRLLASHRPGTTTRH